MHAFHTAIAKGIAFIGITLIALSATFLPAQAASRESITLSPTANTVTVNAGETVTGSFSIVNDGAVKYEYSVYARPYSIKDNRYDSPDFVTQNERSTLYTWISFEQTRFTIEPGATQKVPYTITIPKNSAPGGHYGVIFAETVPPQGGSSESAVLTSKRVGHIIYANVNGQVQLSGESTVNSFDTWQSSPPLTVSFGVKNTGNTHFTVKNTVVVTSLFGAHKYRSEKELIVLPGTERTTEEQWARASLIGVYKVQSTQHFLDKTVEQTGYVLLLPRFIPLILVILILAGVLRAVYRRKRRT